MVVVPIGAVGILLLIFFVFTLFKSDPSKSDDFKIPGTCEFNKESYWIGALETEFLYTNKIDSSQAERYVYLCMQTNHKGNPILVEYIYNTYPHIVIPDMLK